MDGQMSIFDFPEYLPESDKKIDFDTMTIKYAADLIGEHTGLKFKRKDSFNELKDMYVAIKKGLVIDIEFANYAKGVRNGKRHLGVGYQFKTQGGASPCESIDEAVNYIQNKIDTFVNNICKYSKHSCNNKELWKIAESFDDITCPQQCCRKCSVQLCGARCNGSEEPIYIPVDIKGICDDGYCPSCGASLDDLIEKCPDCGTLLDWERWKQLNNN